MQIKMRYHFSPFKFKIFLKDTPAGRIKSVFGTAFRSVTRKLVEETEELCFSRALKTHLPDSLKLRI